MTTIDRTLIQRLRDTASKGVSVWGDLQMEAAKEIEILTAERELYASAMDRMQTALQSQQAAAHMRDVHAEVVASHIQNIRCVKPLECPECHALWLFWPKEQSGFATDTLSVKSATHCNYCEYARADQLVPLDRVQALADMSKNQQKVDTLQERVQENDISVQAAAEPVHRFPFVPWSKEAEMWESWVQTKAPAAEPVGWFINVTVNDESVGDYQLAAREHWGDLSVCIPLYRTPQAAIDDYSKAADKLAMENNELRGVVARARDALKSVRQDHRLKYEHPYIDAAIKDSERVMKTWQERIDTPDNRLSPQHLHVSVEEIQAAMQAEIDDLRARLKAFEDLQPVAWTTRMGIDYLSKGMGITVFHDSEGRDVPLFTWEKL